MPTPSIVSSPLPARISAAVAPSSGSTRSSGSIRSPGAGGKVGRAAKRRKIDPTTCERDYRQEELEFMQAVDAYRRKHLRPFPTCTEILEVVRSLGYRRPDMP